MSRHLYAGSSIQNTEQQPAPDRWSNGSNAPQPRYVVNVTDEADVAAIVKYCNEENLKFYVSNGRTGWANTFNLGECGLSINLAGLSRIEFNQDKSRVTIQGGVRTKELADAAYLNDARVTVGNCNCVGWIGAALGGGLSRTMGIDGTLSEQIISANVVLASGETVIVSADDRPDLFWAMKGAGPNFGVVTSAVLQAYPTPKKRNTVWTGMLIYADDHVKDVLTALSQIPIDDRSAFHTLIILDPDSKMPCLGVVPFYFGGETAALRKFQSVLDIPSTILVPPTQTPYTALNTFNDPSCVMGNLRSTFSALFDRLDPETWLEIYQKFKNFVSTIGPEAVGASAILSENYPRPESSATDGLSMPFRLVHRHGIIALSYIDPDLESVCDEFGREIRDMLQATSGHTANITYINFAHGDESLTDVYGGNVVRLQSLKKIYDPSNRFDQWFPLLKLQDKAPGDEHTRDEL